jgi:small-conductance mechanosensitive channel
MTTTIRSLLALFVASWATLAFGADATSAQGSSIAPPARLEIGGRTIASFRATLYSYRPVDRAEAARLRLLAAYDRNPRLVFTSRHVAEGSQVLADGAVMFMLTPEDVDRAGGDTPELAATRSIEVLRQIVDDIAERHNAPALFRGIGLAVVATLVLILLVRGLFALDRRVAARLSRRVAEQARKVKVSGVSMLDQSFTVRAARRLVHWIAWAFAALITFLWLNAVLESLPFTRPWGEKLTGVLLDALATLGKEILEALPGLVLVVIIFAIARLVSQAASFVLDQVDERDMRMGWLDRHTTKPTRILVTLLIWIFALAMAYPYIPGSESRAFQGLSVLVGLMVSLGASSIVGQAASGLILMYTRVFRAGEYIRIQETEGTVTELGIFATRVRTGHGDEVTLPNSFVLGNVSRNFSRGAGEPDFIASASVTIGYDAPWRQVHAMLEEAARRTPGFRTDPAPRVFQTALSDFYVEYQLAARCAAEGALARADAVSRLHANIQDVFNEHGVQIMSPHYLGDPDRPKVVPRAEWFKSPARGESEKA